ncbi:hypothetical protein HY640_04780 [Candidatus Woesearchaeota archaeon]|nr:hypothetical protein [Candidatus Woesearchaeota archaeon]
MPLEDIVIATVIDFLETYRKTETDEYELGSKNAPFCLLDVRKSHELFTREELDAVRSSGYYVPVGRVRSAIEDHIRIPKSVRALDVLAEMGLVFPLTAASSVFSRVNRAYWLVALTGHIDAHFFPRIVYGCSAGDAESAFGRLAALLQGFELRLEGAVGKKMFEEKSGSILVSWSRGGNAFGRLLFAMGAPVDSKIYQSGVLLDYLAQINLEANRLETGSPERGLADALLYDFLRICYEVKSYSCVRGGRRFVRLRLPPSYDAHIAENLSDNLGEIAGFALGINCKGYPSRRESQSREGKAELYTPTLDIREDKFLGALGSLGRRARRISLAEELYSGRGFRQV